MEGGILKEWVVKRPDPRLVKFLASELGITELGATLLVNRGIKDPEEAERFLNPSLSSIHDPFLMKDMDKAVERTIRALESGERILVYGDYDADGITSTALLVLFFGEIGAKSLYFIPRREDGYGINLEAVKCFHALGIKLIVSVDCGTTSFEAISFAKEKGIDTVVLDHHEVGETYPDCFAFVNPKRKDSNYPFRELAGVGVAFNFVMALRKRLREMGWTGLPNLKDYLDIVAIGTIADVVPLVDQNRIYVRHGLSLIGEGKRPGIRAIGEVSGVGKRVDTFQVGFQIVPRINVAGRLGNARDGVDLLVSPSYDEALKIARKLNELNIRRQQIEDSILKGIKDLISQNPSILNDKALVFAGDNWHLGVVGIVASRLVEEFGRPSVVLSSMNGRLRGSGRSVEGLDLYLALSRCSDLLETFGGHRSAAGLSLSRENLDKFKYAFRKVVSSMLPDLPLKKKLSIDLELSPSEIDFNFVGRELERFSPFGPSNPRPLFVSGKLVLRRKELFGRGNVKLTVEDRGKVFETVGFRFGDVDVTVPSLCRMVYSVDIGDYFGDRYLKFEIEDIRLL